MYMKISIKFTLSLLIFYPIINVGLIKVYADNLKLSGAGASASIRKEISQLYVNGEYAKIIDFVNKQIDIADSNKKNDQFYSGYLILQKAEAKFILGKWKEALKDVNSVIVKFPDYFRSYYLKGVIFLDHGIIAQSKKMFEEAYRLDHNFALTQYFLSEIYLKEKAYDKALYYANGSIQNAPDLLGGYYVRGKIFNELGQYSKALEDFNLLLKNPVKDAAYMYAYYVRAKLLFKEENYRASLKDVSDYEKLVLQYTGQSDLMIASLKSKLYKALGENDKALNEAQRGLQYKTQFAEVNADIEYSELYTLIGQIYFDRNEYSQALSSINIAIKLNPDNQVAKDLLDDLIAKDIVN